MNYDDGTGEYEVTLYPLDCRYDFELFELLNKEVSYNDYKYYNPLYTVGLFHCYMLDKSICHFRGGGYILSLLFYFLMENPVSKQVRP